MVNSLKNSHSSKNGGNSKNVEHVYHTFNLMLGGYKKITVFKLLNNNIFLLFLLLITFYIGYL